jgi:hypothetical protein
MHEENEKPGPGCTPEYCARPELEKPGFTPLQVGQEMTPEDEKKNTADPTPPVKNKD